MKKRLLTYALLLLAGIGIAYGQNNFDFSAVSSSGHTLFYHINPDNTTVTVVSPSGWGWAGSWEWEDYLPWGSLTIPSTVSYGGSTYGVTAIGSNAFADCYDLTSVTIPNTITSIGAFAFYHCNILSLAIPNSVISIGSEAFYLVFNIEYHGTATGCPWGASHLNAFFDDGFVFTDSTMTELISYIGEISDIVIPNTVTTIGNEAFYNQNNTSITSVTIPNSVNQIGDYAFYGSPYLFSVTIQNAATSIGEYAFASCTQLESLALGDSVTAIGDNAFEHCSALTSVAIPNSVSSIGSFAYHNCYNMTSLTIGGSVDTIGDYAFSQCRTLAPVVIPPTITTIGEYAFSNVPLILYCGSATGYPWGAQRCICGYVDGDFVFTDSSQTVLKAYIGNSSNVSIPSSVTSIGDSAFYNCTNIFAVEIPNSVTSIGNSAFSNCRSLDTVSVSNNLSTIGEYAFWECYSLSAINIPVSVDSIGRVAFAYCYNLPSITIPPSVSFIGDNAFISDSLIIYLGQLTGGPWGAERAILYAEGDFLYADSTKSELGLYTGHSSSVVIPNSVTSIWRRAFYENDSLRIVIISDSVTTIEEYSFYNCPNLTKVTFGSSVTNIYQYAFANCSLIDTIVFRSPTPPSLNNANVFYNVPNISTVIVPCHSWFYYQYFNFGYNPTIQETEGCMEYDFWAVSPSNDTLYYRIMDSTSVRVVHPRSDLRWEGVLWPVGQLIIPASVVHEGIEYRITSIAELLFLNDTALTSLSLPYTIDSIGNYAFAYCTQIDTLIYDIDSCIGLNPYNEGAFNSRVFYGDTNISTIFLGNHVKTIPDYSFAYHTHKLSSLHLGDSLKHIGNQAFYGCRLLDTITIPHSVTFIGDMAFIGPEESLQSGRRSHLTTLAIGPSVDTIGNMAFALHSNLNAITVNPANTSFDSRNGCNAIIETATNTLVTGCQSTIIPNNTSAIGYGAFVANPNLHSISIPDSVTSIGNFSFYLCDSLSSITFGSSLSSIGAQAFYGCSRLESLSFPASVSSIGEYAFNGCNEIDSIILSCPTPPSIGYGTFGWEISNIPVTVPCNSISAYINSLWGSTFSNIFEPTACPAITYYDFWDISPSNDTLYYKIIDTSNVACVHPLMYNYNAEQSYWMGYTQPTGRLELPASVIHDGTTYRVSSIRDNSFMNNSDITSVTIPPSIDSLGDFAFAYCNNLDTLYYNPDSCTYWSGQELQWYYEDYYNYYDYSTVFLGDSISSLHIGQNVRWLPNQLFNAPGFNSLETLYFNADSIQTDDRYYHGIFEGLPITTLILSNNVRIIPRRAFHGCEGLTTLTIPDSITNIGYEAFGCCNGLLTLNYNAINCTNNDDSPFYCDGEWEYYDSDSRESYFWEISSTPISITTINIGNSVENIPDYLFLGFNNVTNITIPPSVTHIGNRAFSGCTSLLTITIPDSVSYIGDHAFSNCRSLSSIEIPNTLTHLGNYAFANCISITTASLPHSFDSIDNGLFSNCSALSSCNIPSHVTHIGAFAFKGCSSLSSIIIPDSVLSIGPSAFFGCSSLSAITIPNSVLSIGSDAFRQCSSITTASIGKSIISIGNGAFSYCPNLDTLYFNVRDCSSFGDDGYNSSHEVFNNSSISTLIIGNGVINIPSYAFKRCNHLTQVTIPDSVITIKPYAFSFCSSITLLDIGRSIYSIQSGAFEGCNNIDTIILHCSTPPSFDNSNWYWGGHPTFYQVSTNIPVFVPCNTISTYNSSRWNRFTNLIESTCDRPDLQVLSINIPDSVYSCSDISISAIIKNMGRSQTFSNGWYDVLYISQSDTFNSSAIEINRIRHYAYGTNRLYPDSSYTVVFSGSIPRFWSGETYFYVTTNYENTENEDSTSNNTSQSPMVYVQLPSIVHADSSIFDTACVRYQWHGISYSNSGTYLYTHEYDDSPCINYDTLNLTIWPEYNNQQYVTIMDTESFSFNGQLYNQTGVYTEHLNSIHGCDSIITLHLQVLPIRRPVVHASVCQGLPYNGNRPRFIIPANITSDTLGLMMLRDTIRTLSGLDSIIYGVDLTVLPSILSSASGLVPTQDSAITHGSLLLRWDSVVGATGYRIFLWKIGDNMPTNPTFTTTHTYQNVSAYENRQTYNWKVEAYNPCDTSTSTIQHFLIYKPSYLTTNSHILNFGEIEFNKTKQKILSVTGRDLTDSIRLTLRGSDSSLFTLSTNRINRFGGSVSISFTPTIIRQNYNAYIIINSGYIYDTVFLSSTLANYYVFNVSVADSILPPNTPVAINGTLENAAHQAPTNIPVDIYITIMGQTTVVTDTTDSTGDFNAIYSPKLSECGYYTVGACLHGDNSRHTLTSFNIPGVSLVNPHPVWEVTQYDTLFGAIALRNRCNVPLHNISLSVDSMPTGISLQFDSLTLGAFQTDSLHFALVGNIRSIGDQYEDIKLSVHCTEGQLTRMNAYYYCYKPIPDLQISFDSIVCAVVPGVQKVVDMALINNTDSLFNNIQVRTPTGQSYIQQLSMDSSINIAPHDTVFIPLLILFPQNTPSSTVSDEIWVTADNTQSQQVPFFINIVPNATGSLRVLVSNEYTYYNNGPHVSGAEISVVGYYRLDTVAFGVTDSSGWMLFDSVPEGYYKLFVSAPENSPFSRIIQIRAGEQTFVDVDLDFEAITYEWVVYQEDIEGNYGVTLNTRYKTNVPKPVVTIETSPIDIPPDGSFATFNMVVSNHGLIDAFDATIEMPTSSVFEYIALYDRIDTVPALSSVTIPCHVRNRAIYDTIENIHRRGNYYIDTLYNVIPRRESNIHYMDTLIYIPTTQEGVDSNGVSIWEYDTTIMSIPYYTIDTIYDSTVTNIIYYDALLSEVLLDIDMNPRFNNQKQHNSSKSLFSGSSFRSNNDNCPIEISRVKVRVKYRCNDNGEKETISEEILGTAHTKNRNCFFTGSGTNSKEDIAKAIYDKKRKEHRTSPPVIIHSSNIYSYTHNGIKYEYDPVTPWYINYPDWECQPCGYIKARAAYICNEFSNNDAFAIQWWPEKFVPRCYFANLDATYQCEKVSQSIITRSTTNINHSNNISNLKINSNTTSPNITASTYHQDVDVFARNIRIVKQYYDYLLADWKRIVNDTLPVFDSNPEILGQIMGYLHTTNIATVEELATCYDNTVTIIDTSTLRRYAERWNRTLIYSRYSWTIPSMVPTGFSLDYYYPDTNITAAMAAKIDTAIALGYESIEDMYDKTIEAMISSPAKHSQCASASLQFNQDYAMTRESFTGILSIKNPHSTQPLNNLKTLFFVTDTLGHDCSDKFDISITKWDGIDTTTKSIAADSRGNITVQFVPLISAAPTDTVPYLFGGSIEYINPYTNDTTSDDLEPVRLPVSPSPHLQLDYFIPHDIIADDPLTSPIIEYTIPATIGLRMKNDGYGTAKNVRIATIQPQITENQLGLVVEFRMLETMRNGAGHSQPLSDINLGNVLPSETQTLEYYLMSSLLGTLTVQDVNVIHKSSVDDKDMSLVDARAHRLVKPVLQYGTLCDSIHDFLTDDIPNGYNIPDSLYLSNGSATAVYEATNTIFDHYVTPSDIIVQVTLYPDTIGWNYGETDDPGRGKYEILSCVRDDSTNIPLDNIWLTFVDLLEDQDPIYINKLHIVDTLSTARTTTYNVTFGLKNNLLDVDTIVLLPLSDANASLDSFMVLFNKPVIDSTFTYSDMSLRFNNGEELMDSTISVRQISDSTFCVDVSQKTLAAGLYVLKVFADSIVDANGHYGYGGKEIHWVRTICTPYNEIDTVTTCDSYTWHNRLLTESGIYKDTIQSFGGCDSIFTLSLTINNSSTDTETVSACDNYTWHGTTYTVSTNAPTYSSYNATGCDSIVTLHLTIYNSTTTTEAVTACDNYTWHDSIYTSSTTMPTYTTTNAVGCDSVTTLHLTVNFSTSDTETVTACDNYTWHDSIYTTSTTMPTYTTTNAVGCDSVTTLHLTVNFSTTDTEYVTACDSYTWHDSTYTTSTTMPTYTTANTVGCDSVTTLYLTVNFSTTDTESVTACDSYTWHDSTYTTSTTTPVYITNNNVGCDSIVTLNLTIYYSSTGVDNQTACDSYIWIDGITYTISTSEPTVTTTNIYGCDSTVTLHLTINYSTHDTIIDTATNSYEWNGEVLTESGVYVYEGQTGAGCDSIVTLRLTINHVGFADDAESESLNIYPNPTTGKLIIEAEGVAKVEVFDYSGRIVATFLNINEVDISHLPTGAYSLRITLHNGTAVKRIIKK